MLACSVAGRIHKAVKIIVGYENHAAASFAPSAQVKGHGNAQHSTRIRCSSVAAVGCSAGAAAFASCLSSSGCHLEVLNLSGCEVADEGAAALATAITGPACAVAAAGTSTGWQQVQHRIALRELKLADNQITAAGDHMRHLT